jgi:hypothetical protein
MYSNNYSIMSESVLRLSYPECKALLLERLAELGLTTRIGAFALPI